MSGTAEARAVRGSAAEEAVATVAGVRNDPAKRLELASRFYDDRPRLAIGRLAPVGRLIGDPRWRGADVFLSLHNILPDRYPLTAYSIDQILALENHAGRVIDYGVMLPKMQALYEFAAADLDEPRLLSFVREGSRSTRGPTKTGTPGPRLGRVLSGASCPG